MYVHTKPQALMNIKSCAQKYVYCLKCWMEMGKGLWTAFQDMKLLKAAHIIFTKVTKLLLKLFESSCNNS